MKPIWKKAPQVDILGALFEILRRQAMERMFERIAMSVVAVGLIGSPAASAEIMTPLERVASTPKGELKSPYADIAAVAEQGRQIYRSLDCGGCHGGGGGGGMAAPLTNQVWIYGNDDDTLFRLITLGTGSLSIDDGFTKQGFVRKGSENVVGPMPPYGRIVKREDDIWKIIAWIRSQIADRP
jgi:mono/diheme cytochrome c family protein